MPKRQPSGWMTPPPPHIHKNKPPKHQRFQCRISLFHHSSHYSTVEGEEKIRSPPNTHNTCQSPPLHTPVLSVSFSFSIFLSLSLSRAIFSILLSQVLTSSLLISFLSLSFFVNLSSTSFPSFLSLIFSLAVGAPRPPSLVSFRYLPKDRLFLTPLPLPSTRGHPQCAK